MDWLQKAQAELEILRVRGTREHKMDALTYLRMLTEITELREAGEVQTYSSRRSAPEPASASSKEP